MKVRGLLRSDYSIKAFIVLSLPLLLWVTLSQAAPMFTAEQFSAGSNPTSVVLGDMNGDGSLDMAVANRGNNNVNVRLGDGIGGFAGAFNHGVGRSPSSVVLGDIDADGKLDMVVANEVDHNVSVLLGDGAGGYAFAINYDTGGTWPLYVALGDMNGDYALDIVVPNTGSNNVSILLGNGTGDFATAVSYGVGTSPRFVALGDMNGDGALDMAVTNSSSDNVSILLGNGTGDFATAVNFATGGTTPYSVALGDINGDGALDMAVANPNSINVGVLLGDGAGGYAPATTYTTAWISHSVALGDMNGDGSLDMAVANRGSNNVSILLGDGTGNFATAVNYMTGTAPYSVALGDMNGDGALDMATANYNSNNVSVFLNQLDVMPPTGTLSINSGAIATNSTSVVLTLSCNDGTGSGCNQMQFSNDGSSWSGLEAYTTSKVWNITAGDGSKTVYVQYRDSAGNVSSSYNDSITLDTVAPTAPSISTPANSTVSSTTSVMVSGSAGANSTVNVYDAVSILGSVSTDGSGNWSLGSGVLGEGSHSFTATATDSASNSSIASVAVIYTVDTTAPVMTLNGGNVTIEAGTSYTDLGAIANDVVDGTVAIATTGSVNTSVPGTYILSYDYTDTAGNAAVQVTRTVTVVDTTVPVITLNGGNVTIEAGISYTDLGAIANDVVDGVVSIFAMGLVDTTTTGTYTLTYDYTDTAGNAATQVTRTVTVIDTTAPSTGGGSGGGCTLNPKASQNEIDPLLPLLLLTSSVYLWRRRRSCANISQIRKP